jgi:uncharacterized protein YhaN
VRDIMLIENLKITGFGNIDDSSFLLSEGMNIVFGTNESGKSTIQAYIKAMFYGLKGGRAEKDGTKAPIKKFRPWNNSSYGGSLSYRLDNGERFVIERNFEKSTINLYDSGYNDISNLFLIDKDKEVKFAEKHIGIDEYGFERTAFIGQLSSRLDSMGSKELISRLINANQTGFEDISFKNAQKALKEALIKNIGTERTSTRPLDKVNIRLAELKSLRGSLLDKRNSLNDIKRSLDESIVLKEAAELKKQFFRIIVDCIELKKEISETDSTCTPCDCIRSRTQSPSSPPVIPSTETLAPSFAKPQAVIAAPPPASFRN